MINSRVEWRIQGLSEVDFKMKLVQQIRGNIMSVFLKASNLIITAQNIFKLSRLLSQSTLRQSS